MHKEVQTKEKPNREEGKKGFNAVTIDGGYEAWKAANSKKDQAFND